MNGLINWFTRNGVAANLLMVTIIMAGVFSLAYKIPLEVFPDFDIDRITVSMPYRGATPSEVEEGVVIRIEEAIQDLEGIEEIISTSSEGVASVMIEVDSGYDPRELLDDIKNRIDAISTFPDETERPIINVAQRSSRVINVVVSGNLSERELRRLGDQVRDEIANLPGITQVALKAVRPYEISIEVSEYTLRRHGLSFDQVTRAVRNSSIDLPAGAIKTRGGEILLRTKGQAYVQEDFEKIILLTREDGTRLTLGEIATVRDGFEETPLLARFNGKQAVLIDVMRVGDQNAITLAQTVKEYLADAQGRMPPGVELSYWQDRAKIVKGRLNTLTDSTMWGGLLVFLLLTLLLRFSLAFWVCLGIPVSFLGAIALMPFLDVTINIISLFAFILVLGIVVDDAIIVGENIFTHLQHQEDPVEAASVGAQEVAIPVIFGVLTTIIAFTPLLMIGGFRGKIFFQIPAIVIPVLLFSIVESKLILPAHLKHLKVGKVDRAKLNPLARWQRKIADGFEWLVVSYYKPILARAMKRRYLTLSIFIGVFVLFLGVVMSGRIRFTYFPRVQSERARARLDMPLGTPVEITANHVSRMETAAEKLRDKHIDPESGESVIEHILATLGGESFGGRGGGRGGQSHKGEVVFQIVPPEERSIEVKSTQLVAEWRKLIGVIPGAEELNFRAEIGRGGDPIDIQLTGSNFEDLSEIVGIVEERLQQYPGVFDITNTFQDGKQEIKLAIKPEAEHLGLTMSDLARQVRQAFFGQEAQRIPRGREDVRVMIRYPEDERRSLANLETMRIRTPDGIEVPFSSVAEAKMGRGFSTIRRVNRNRTINVRADINKKETDLAGINEDLIQFLPRITSQYPGVNWSFEGEAREQRESFGSLYTGSLFVLFAIYAMMAIPFKSYVQPLIVMTVIPFGLVGAVLGHIIMGMNLSILSTFGMLALTGVVVNDSLVLVHYVNSRRKENMTLHDAVRTAGVARFRPIILTSLTTFAGLSPLILGKSTQAQFLIPMAVSLGFGILFATFITLILIPINYLILEDIKNGVINYFKELHRLLSEAKTKFKWLRG